MKQADWNAEWIGWRIAVLWTVLCAGLIVLLSLVPAQWSFESAHLAARWSMFVDSMRHFSWQGDHYSAFHLLRDMATNFLLYLPLGLLAPWIVPRGAHVVRRVLLTLAGPALSLAMEMTQIATDRYPTMSDWVMNSLGYLAGYVIVSVVVARFGLGAGVFLGSRGRVDRATLAGALRLIYLPLLLLLSLLPFDVSVGMELLWSQITGAHFATGRVFFNPLAPWNMERFASSWTAFALLFPFGFLSMQAHPEWGRRAFWRYGLARAAMALVIEVAQLFVLSRTSDVVQILSGGLGSLAGVVLARFWEGWGVVKSSSAQSGESPPFTARDSLFLALMAWCMALVWINWRPFQFEFSATDAILKLVFESNWIPFGVQAQYRFLDVARDLGREIAWFVPFGMLAGLWLARARPQWKSALRLLWVLSATGLWGGFLELGQCAIKGRFVDVTDVISHVAGAWIGWLLAGLLKPADEPNDSLREVH